MHFPVWQLKVCKTFARSCILWSQDNVLVEKPSLSSSDACSVEISLRCRQAFNGAHGCQMSHDVGTVGLR